MTQGRTAAWFGFCALLGWIGAAVLYQVHPVASLLALGLGGALAGGGLHLGGRHTVGCVITYLVGNVGAFLPIMATQAMTGHETFGQLLAINLVAFVGAYSFAAAIGFLDLAHLRMYAHIVGGFALGGAIGAAMLTTSITLLQFRGFWVVALVALVIPTTVGGAILEGARRDASKRQTEVKSPDAV